MPLPSDRPRIRDLAWVRLYAIGVVVALSGPVLLALDIARGLPDPEWFVVYAVLWIVVPRA